MGEMIQLTTSDRHTLAAYRAAPAAATKGGVVILQEIFGITGHIQRVVDQYAENGYLTIAPSLFDRARPGILLDYASVDEARSIMTSLDLDEVITDIDAAVRFAGSVGRVAAIGYCWGGALADLAACRLDIDAAVSYYGRMTADWLDEQPRCPIIYHFGGNDPLIPAELIEKIGTGRPNHPAFIYADAGHGFNCDERDDFDPDSAQLALERTLDFMARHVG